MAVITPGSGGTCKSTTAEGQLHEVLSFISLKQANTTTNPEGATNVSGTHNQQALVFTGTYRFSVSQSIGEGGSIVLTANSYLVGPNFYPGTGGTFSGNTPEKYALEVLMYIQSLEAVAGLNPQNRNFMTGTYNIDNQTYQGSFTIPVSLSIAPESGAVLYDAVPYLL